MPAVKRMVQVKRDSVPASVADTLAKLPVVDSVKMKDSLQALHLADSLRKDSLDKIALKSKMPTVDTSTFGAILPIPYLPFGKPPAYMLMQEKPIESKDELFYLLAGIVLFAGIVKALFPKYFNSIFQLFFQTSFRQKQTRDQLLQNNLASFLFNILFVICGGVYIGLIAHRYFFQGIFIWWLILYGAAVLGGVYFLKYIFLLFSGWIFNVREAANTYIFIVFLLNKIIGIVLIPFLLILAFSENAITGIVLTVSASMIGLLFLYRYIASLGTIRRDLKVSALNFFLYLCAVEILPLLLILKFVINYMGRSV